MPSSRNRELKYERIPQGDIEKALQAFDKRFKAFLSLKGFPNDVKVHN
jgi:hypothetical protein